MRLLPVLNPPNPFASTEVEYVASDDEGAGPPNAELQIFLERGKTVVAENDSPDLGFRYSVNPYRGCMHACAYCYARPSHQYWGFGAGTDFDRKIIVKENAPELLREAFMKRSWVGERILFSGNTDCYQPLESTYGLTRKCLEVCLEFQNPCSVITKSALIRRDIALMGELAKRVGARVTISVPFASSELARAIEPYASSPAARFDTIRRLADVGVPVGVNVAPVIPALNDQEIAEILERARDAGASRASLIPVRLPKEVLPVFTARLEAAFPERAKKVLGAISEMRGGKLNEGAFGARMEGKGPRWSMIQQLFEKKARSLGLARPPGEEHLSTDDPPTPFRRPTKQRSLFD